MGKLGCFLLGFLISSWVSCAVAYFAGRTLLEDYRKLHDKAIETYSRMHADAIAAFTRIGKVIE